MSVCRGTSNGAAKQSAPASGSNRLKAAVAARRLNLEGDGQGDLAGHGGEQRAVLVYQTDSYRYWERTLGRSDFTFGQFGENFTVEGLLDSEVCIGDRYRIGSALFEVSQPRVTCYRVGIRLNDPRMPALLVAHHRPGFYLRVLEEGDVGAGDEITKVAEGPERFTVADMDALLYLPGHHPDQLQRALRIPALSAGWKGSFEALAKQEAGVAALGNPGLSPAAGPPPAWRGFQSLRVSRVDRESTGIISLTLEATDGSRLPPALPGQFIVLRLRSAADQPALLRNYSLSGIPDAGSYRVSVKQELNGKGSTFLHTHIKDGDVLEVSAPRGSFTLQPGDGPVVLLSAGIGATPVLAMLHALAASRSTRPIWWLYGARNAAEQPFAREARDVLAMLPHARSFVAYSRPAPEDRLGDDYDAPGHLSLEVLEKLGVPREADFYLCGPAPFLRSFTQDLQKWGVAIGRRASGGVRSRGSDNAGHRQNRCPAAASAGGRPRCRADGILRTERSRCAMELCISEPAGTCRGLRHSGEMVVPDRGLPHMRVRVDRRRPSATIRSRSSLRPKAMC